MTMAKAGVRFSASSSLEYHSQRLSTHPPKVQHGERVDHRERLTVYLLLLSASQRSGLLSVRRWESKHSFSLFVECSLGVYRKGEHQTQNCDETREP